MKKYIYIAIASLIAILGISVAIQTKRINNLKDRLTETQFSLSAYSEENSKLKKSNKMFILRVEDLENLNDSLMNKMNDMRKQLGIKDKQIKELGYLASTAHKTDTLRIRDTLFKDPDIKIDTTIKDKEGWYRCDVGLYYPNILVIEPSFKSEKYIITSQKRETVKPPKKCWIGRLFQKKHDVITIDVVENNPYITKDKERFITIVK